MASEVKTNKVSPATSTTINVGDSGDTLALAVDDVTGFNVGSDAAGDVLYNDGTDYTRLAKPGTPADEVLTFATGASAPSWVAASGGGKILQVIQGFTVTSDTTTSTSFVITPLTASITPVSTSNKILVSANFYSGYPTQNYSCIYALYRDSTTLDQSSGMTGFINAGNSSADGHFLYQGKTVAMQFLDSPSSTSAITYAVFFKANGGGAYFNVNRNADAGSKATAVIILQEVDGT